MPSKYDSVLHKLQPAPVTDQSWQDRVDQIKSTITTTQPAALADAYIQLRTEKTRLSSALADCNARLEAFTQLLTQSQEEGAEGWGQYGASPTTLRLMSGDTLRIQREPYAVVVDKDANRRWAMHNGLQRLLVLPWQTISSYTKEALLNGAPEPDGVKCWVKTKVVYKPLKKGSLDTGKTALQFADEEDEPF